MNVLDYVKKAWYNDEADFDREKEKITGFIDGVVQTTEPFLDKINDKL